MPKCYTKSEFLLSIFVLTNYALRTNSPRTVSSSRTDSGMGTTVWARGLAWSWVYTANTQFVLSKCSIGTIAYAQGVTGPHRSTVRISYAKISSCLFRSSPVTKHSFWCLFWFDTWCLNSAFHPFSQSEEGPEASVQTCGKVGGWQPLFLQLQSSFPFSFCLCTLTLVWVPPFVS